MFHFLKSSTCVFVLLVAVAGFLLLSFAKSESSLNAVEAHVLSRVNAHLKNALMEFSDKLELLRQAEAQGLEEEKLQRIFLDCREAFKKSEFILMFAETYDARKINGPNIIINESNYFKPYEERKPHGLQLIETLIYNPGEQSRAVLKYEIGLLKARIAPIAAFDFNTMGAGNRLQHAFIWEAIRRELFRIETLGITGFDVPESENAIPETYKAIRSLATIIAFYRPVFEHNHMLTHYQALQQTFDKALLFLAANQDFNSFDRLQFKTEFLIPISKLCHKSIQVLNYVLPENEEAVNTGAAFLYAENIFNTGFFMPGFSGEKAALGKRLFFNKNLSGNGSRSCATCHIPEKAFSDGLAKNLSLDGKSFLARNTPTLLNAVYQKSFFYDSRADKLSKQAFDVIHNQKEMDGDLKALALALQQDSTYQSLFRQAGFLSISPNTIAIALSSYVATYISFNTPFDKYLRGDKSALSEAQKRGYNLFAGKAKCATCHFEPMFNGLVPPSYVSTESEIIGVPAAADKPTIIDEDEGKYSFTKLAIHKYAFKTPTIRNTALTAPYMHNGIYHSLEEVMDFYNKGGGKGQGMPLESQTLPDKQLNLSEQEIQDIIAFINALTDVPDY